MTQSTRPEKPERRESRVVVRPVVVRTRRRRRPRYSPGLASVDATTRSLAVASYGLARAIAAGLRRYLEASDRSARRRTNGAFEDFPRNVAEALSTAIGESRDVPRDIARTLETPEVKRMIRRSIRAADPFDRRFLRWTMD